MGGGKGGWKVAHHTQEGPQEGMEIDDLTELGNESISTEREGAGEMTSQGKRGPDWGQPRMKGT